MAYGYQESGFGGVQEHLAPLLEKKIVLRRQLAVGSSGAVVIAACLGAALFLKLFFAFFMLLAVVAAIAVWYFWRYTRVEYEYVIAQRDVTFSAIYAKKSRRDLFSFSLKDAESIVPYREEKSLCDKFPADETRFYASRYDDENTLCALLNLEDGKKVRLFFQGSPAVVAALRRANPAAVRIGPGFGRETASETAEE